LRLEGLEPRDLLAALTWSPGVDLPAPRGGAAAAMTVHASSGLTFGTPTASQAGARGAPTPAPTVPTGLTVTGVTTNTVSLSWNPSTDGIGVAGYRVFQVSHTGWHGNTIVYTQLADVTTTTATVGVPYAGYSYQFVVAAYNASGSQSGYSGAVSATTLVQPSYTGPSGVNGTAQHPMSFRLTATGNPASFTFSALNVPAGMTVDPSTGVVSWTPPDSAVGAGWYTFGIANSAGTSTAVVQVQVAANVPAVTSKQDAPAVATQPVQIQFTRVADPYNTSPITYSLVTPPAGVSLDPSSGLVTWTPTAAQVGTNSVTVRATNYAGYRDTALTIPVAFASAARSVTASNVTASGVTLNWSAPSVNVNPIQGYNITLTYWVGTGRGRHQVTLRYTVAGAGTTDLLTGLPGKTTFYVSVTARDASGNVGLAGTTSFTTL
jgi:hypothetical protein